MRPAHQNQLEHDNNRSWAELALPQLLARICGVARLWFNSLVPNSITTWEWITRKFMLKYFPPSRIVKFKNEITSFAKMENESFYDAWERFMNLLRKCP